MKPIQKNIILLSELCSYPDEIKKTLVFEIPIYLNIESVLMTAEDLIKEIDCVNMSGDFPEECGSYEELIDKLNECRDNDWLIDIEN